MVVEIIKIKFSSFTILNLPSYLSHNQPSYHHNNLSHNLSSYHLTISVSQSTINHLISFLKNTQIDIFVSLLDDNLLFESINKISSSKYPLYKRNNERNIMIIYFYTQIKPSLPIHLISNHLPSTISTINYHLTINHHLPSHKMNHLTISFTNQSSTISQSSLT